MCRQKRKVQIGRLGTEKNAILTRNIDKWIEARSNDAWLVSEDIENYLEACFILLSCCFISRL